MEAEMNESVPRRMDRPGPILICPWYGAMALCWHRGAASARSRALGHLRSARQAVSPHRSLEGMVEALAALGMREPQRLYLLLMEHQALMTLGRPPIPQSIARRLIVAILNLQRQEVRCRVEARGYVAEMTQ